MIISEYKAALKALGLTPGRPSYKGATIYMDRDGTAHSIPNPEELSPDERRSFIALLTVRISVAD